MPKPCSIEFHRTSSRSPFPWQKEFLSLCLQILKDQNATGHVNIVLCPDQEVRHLNSTYRKLDKVTDVLSFEWHREGILGEIYIAEEQVRKQAPRFGNSFRAELRRMLIHGVLHLCGHDHMQAKERTTMRDLEDYYWNLRR